MSVTFHGHETTKLDMPHDDTLVITLDLGGTSFSRILIVTGGAANILSQEAFESIEHPPPLDTLEKMNPFKSTPT